MEPPPDFGGEVCVSDTGVLAAVVGGTPFVGSAGSVISETSTAASAGEDATKSDCNKNAAEGLLKHDFTFEVTRSDVLLIVTISEKLGLPEIRLLREFEDLTVMLMLAGLVENSTAKVLITFFRTVWLLNIKGEIPVTCREKAIPEVEYGGTVGVDTAAGGAVADLDDAGGETEPVDSTGLWSFPVGVGKNGSSINGKPFFGTEKHLGWPLSLYIIESGH